MTLIRMDEGLDTGPILVKARLPLDGSETGGDLHDRLAELSPEPLATVLAELEESGRLEEEAQDDELATYAPKLARADGELDWLLSAEALERRIRAYHPWPGTFTWLTDSGGKRRRLKIYPSATVVSGEGGGGGILQADGEGVVVATGKGALKLDVVQLDGGRRLTAAEFLAGHTLRPGERFFSLEKDAE